MKFKRIMISLSLFLIAAMCLGCVAASQDNNMTVDSPILESVDESNNQLTVYNDSSVLEEPQTIYVDNIGENHNEMNEHTIRNAINSASAGDTIVVNGQNYVHTHLLIDKPLTIRSDVGTTLDPCTSTAYSGYPGVFYITSNANGTIIEGFTFVNDDLRVYGEGYAILVDGASNVKLKNCTISNNGEADAIRLVNSKDTLIQNVTTSDAVNGIRIVNSENINVEDSNIYGNIYGINIIDSTKTTINSNTISSNKVAGICVAGTSRNSKIIYNNLTNNAIGVNLTSSDYVYILSNYIAHNTHGVYVNCNVTKIEIKGNFFNQNKMYEVLNDYRVKNLVVNKVGYPDLEIIDNNYMVGLEGGDSERPVYRNVYEYRGANKGDYSYDSANDVYKYVGTNKGSYILNKGAVFLRYVFEINKNVQCPVIYYQYGPLSWSLSGNYELQLSEITQVKKGIYSISIVDENGNIAKDLSSVPVTFYINKANKHVKPDEGDVYKTVMMVNGTATVRFYQDDFAETGNVITAVFPTNGANFDDKVAKSFNVDDSSIPGTPSNTTLTVSYLSTYPNSNQQFTVTLKDTAGNAIIGENVTINLNSKNYNITTDSNGKAAIKVSISKEGSYVATVSYLGDEVDYNGCSARANVVVKKQTSKIVASNLNMIPKRAEYYSVTLKDGSNKAIANQMVTFKINGKTYTRKTNSKGIAKIKLSFSKNQKTYPIVIKFAGNNKHKASSASKKIVVKYSSKVAKLTTPTVTIPPKTAKTYTVTLSDVNAKGIANQKVTVKINGKTYNKKTNSKGTVSVKVEFSSLKTYTVKATYMGSVIYKKASSTGKIKVAKTATKITAPTISTLPNEAKTYMVTLKTSTGKALSKQKLTIKVNGKTYTKTTNSKGQVGLSVKLSDEKSYSVAVIYNGNSIYKASKTTGKINVAKIATSIESYDRTYSFDLQKGYLISLKDKSDNPLANQKMEYFINNEKFIKTTDNNGQIKVNLTGNDSFDLRISYSGNGKYKTSSANNRITVLNQSGIIFVDENLPNYQIQDILDDAPLGSFVEFLGDYYSDVELAIDHGMTVYSNNGTILNATENKPALTISADTVLSINNFVICGNSNDAVDIINASNVYLISNSIVNQLDKSKTEEYVNGIINMPGYGVKISNSSDVALYGNVFSLFESGIFAEYSSNLNIRNNTLSENNYGIKYGYGVANTEIFDNRIIECVGLYTMAVPEGPSGYGIFLNNSAVNVTISHNFIAGNHIGISLDANYSTGIVITQNTISDNVLEGIRFNAGYDLAENAVEPVVIDNAIYRNARGPSMMILGEMSANPEGIYGPGQWNESLRLKIGPNWYGTNNLVTWDYDTGVVGYGTMCPRISTTAIKFDNLTFNSPGNYSIIFYKEGEVASNLSDFEMFATLNRGTAKEIEVQFNVTNGVGTFVLNATNYNIENNIIEISVGSLIDSTYRTFKITFSYNVRASEIPV